MHVPTYPRRSSSQTSYPSTHQHKCTLSHSCTARLLPITAAAAYANTQPCTLCRGKPTTNPQQGRTDFPRFYSGTTEAKHSRASTVLTTLHLPPSYNSLGHYYKTLFRLIFLPSSRWYKGLKCSFLHVTPTPAAYSIGYTTDGQYHPCRQYEGGHRTFF